MTGLRPEVTLSRTGTFITASWPPVDGAASYHVTVTDGSGAVVHQAGTDAPSASFPAAPGSDCTVQVYAMGPTSVPETISVPAGSSVLGELRDRLVAARTAADGGGFAYPLDPALPDGTADGAVRAALCAALGETELTVTASGEPVLAPDSLRLDGTSGALTGDPATEVSLVFTESDTLALRATWTAVPPPEWTLADSFDALARTAYAALSLTGCAFAATTFAHSDPDFWFPLLPGLQFQATLPVPGDLTPAVGDEPAGAAAMVRVGGPVELTDDGQPMFTWTSQAPTGTLTIARVGQDALTMTGGELLLSFDPAGDPAASAASLTVTGQVPIGGEPASCVVDLPTVVSGSLTLRAVDPSFSWATGTAALAGLGTSDVLGAVLPAGLLALTGATLTGYAVEFDPAGTAPTRTTVTLSFGTDTWTLVPALNLAVSALELDLTVIRAIGYRPVPVLSYGVEVRGRLSLGTGVYSVRGGMPPEGDWYFDLTADGPGLDDLAGLAGMSAGEVTGVLPSSLWSAGEAFTLSRVSLRADPAGPSLTEVAFSIAQARSWSLADSLSLSDWTVSMALTLSPDGTWATSGTVTGTVTLGPASLVLDLQVPVSADDSRLSLALAPGSIVELPSIGSVLTLAGADPALLPTGLATLDGLTITGFGVSVDPAAATLEHVYLRFEQASDWVIIPDTLAVSGTSASLGFWPGSDPAEVTGVIEGNLIFCGTTIGVSVRAQDDDGGWTLRAAYYDFVPVSGWAGLDDWLDRDAAATGVPGWITQVSQFSVGAVFLHFDQAGALVRFGFSVAIPDPWEVIAGDLVLEQVSGDLELSYQVAAPEVTGMVSAVIALAGASIGVTASKPDPGAPWEFTGVLLAGFTFDLVEAARSVSTDPRELPSDAITLGLPASIDINSGSIRVIPDTGLFHVEAGAGLDWQFPLGSATLSVTSIGGSIDVPYRGAPVTAAVTGTFDYAGCHVLLTLALGGPAAQTVLTGVLTTSAAAAVRLGDLTDGIAAPAPADRWDAVIPADTPDLTFSDATLYLNLSTSQFMLYGHLRYGTTPAVSAFAYLAPATAEDTGTGGTGPAGGPLRYAVALALGDGFRFGDLFPALAPVDEYVTVAAAHLIICDLGGEPLAGLRQTTTTLLASIAPAEPAALAGLTDSQLALVSGVSFAAKIDFDPVTLFGWVLQIGTPDDPEPVWLSALIDRSDPTRSEFTADLPDITIVSTIRFTRIAPYPGIRLSYFPASGGRFELAGRMVLSGVFGNQFQFDVGLAVSGTGLTSTVTQTSQQIASPFGIDGLVLSGLALEVSYVWAVPARDGEPAEPQTSTFTLSGQVTLGPAPAVGQSDQRFSCGSRLVLLSGQPVLFDVLLDRDWSIGAFITQCLAGGAWPSDFVEVTFNQGTRIYYYATANDPGRRCATAPDGYAYAAGFNVDARLTVTLIGTLHLHAVVTVLTDLRTGGYIGVRCGVQLDDPLDLGFAQLASRTPPPAGQPYAGGPLLAFQTGQTGSFLLSTGINFLDAAFAGADITVTAGSDGGTVISGQLQTEPGAELYPFGSLDCGFTYTTHPDSDSDFVIDGWPRFGWARELVDFMAAIRSLTTAGSGCGELAALAVNSAYRSDFDITPSVSASGRTLTFALTGTYSLFLAGTDIQFVSVTLPSFNVAVPAVTRWQDLPEVLAVGFAEAAAGFARDLLSQPDKIAMFLAMVCGPTAVQAALRLVCEGLTDAAVAAATQAAVTAITKAATAAAAVSDAALMIASALADSNDGGSGGGGGGSGGGDGGGSSGIGTPRLRTLSYAGTELAGTWDAAQGAANYTFALARQLDGGEVASLAAGQKLSGALTVDAAALPAGAYRGEVKGTRSGQSGDWSGLPVSKLPGPVVTLTYTGSALMASWPAAGADSYAAAFTDPAGQRIGGEIGVPGTQTSVSLPLPEPAAGTYHVTVRADRAGQFPGAWSDPAACVPLSLPAPLLGAVTRDGATFTIAWTAAAPCAARITAGGTMLAGMGPVDPPAELTVAGTLPPSVRIGVQARAPGALSPWASQDFAVWDVPAPDRVTLADDAGAVTAVWPPVTVSGGPAVSYDVVLLQDGTPVGAQAGLTSPAIALPLPGTTLTEGRGYQLQVRARAGGNLGPPTTSAVLTVVTVPAPGGVTLTAAGSVITLAWSAVAGPSGDQVSYDVSLLRDGAQVGAASGVTGLAAVLARTDGRPPVPGESYTARVRAVSADRTSAWASAGPVSILGTPRVTAASYQDGRVTVAWQDSRSLPGVAYQVMLSLAGAEPIVAMALFNPGTTSMSWVVTMTGQPRGAYTAQVRQHTASSDGAWSDGLPVLVLDPPAQVSASYDDGQITASWPAAGAATGYRVTLGDPGGARIDEQTVTAPAASFPASSLTSGATYAVAVTALAGTVQSAAAATTTVTLADPPAGLRADFDGTSINLAWSAAPAATSYRLTLHAPQTGDEVRTDTATGLTDAMPALGLAHGVPYSVTAAAMVGAAVSRPSAPVQVTVVTDPPGGVSAVFDGSQIVATWQQVLGARTYQAQIFDPGGRLVATATSATTTLVHSGPEILAGVPYTIRVSSATYPGVTYSPQVPVRQDGFTCLCVGTSLGQPCGNGGVPGSRTDVVTRVSQQRLDTGFYPSREPGRTGWVAVPPGEAGTAAVLARLIVELTQAGFFSAAEAFALFAPPPSAGGGTGGVTCLCLGTTPGGSCGNGGLPAGFASVMTGVPQTVADGQYRPAQSAPRTGWVTVPDQPWTALEVIVQLVTVLGAPGKLGSTMPWDVFRKSTQAAITTGAGGPATCVALGAPIGGRCTTMYGAAGDVVVSVSQAEVATLYRPGVPAGWASFGPGGHTALPVLVRLVAQLAGKGVLTGTQPYDIFNTARAAHSQ